MMITIINDCRDANAVGRQSARASSLLNAPISFIGVASDLEAAGNLIDMIDAAGNNTGAILVNVAPRNGKAKKWPNGAPFGYFWHGNVLVVASIDGFTLSLVKKLKIVDHIQVLDTADAVDELIAEGIAAREYKDRIVNSQFRSYDFIPRIAAHLIRKRDIKSRAMDIEQIPDIPKAIWWIDNFGNCKTTIVSDEIEVRERVCRQARFNNLSYVPALKDVADGTPALIAGSSGLGEKRFLEIVVQGGNASTYFALASGDRLL